MKHWIMALAIIITPGVIADERADHFEGAKVTNMSEALVSLQKHNQELQQLLQGELTPAKMAELHKLTYSLENAMRMIQSSTQVAAEHLERVHIGSEQLKRQQVLSNAKVYLDFTVPLTEQTKGSQ